MSAQLSPPPEKNESSRDKLLQRQAELTEQLKEAQIALYSEDAPEVLAERTRLQISAAQYQQQWQHSQAQYEQTTHELAQYDKDREQILLDAIQQQRWFWIKNKRELLFDSHSGYIFPNFQFVPHVTYNDWKNHNAQANYAPSAFYQGQWEATIGDEQVNDTQLCYWISLIETFPHQYRNNQSCHLYIYRYDKRNYPYYYFHEFKNENNRKDSQSGINNNTTVLPYLNRPLAKIFIPSH